MQTTQYYEMRPYIQMQPYPINSRMNDLEEDFDAAFENGFVEGDEE